MSAAQIGLPGIKRYPAVPSAKNKTGASAIAAVKARSGKDDAYTFILRLLKQWDSTPTECAQEASAFGLKGDPLKAVLFFRPRVSELKQTILETTGKRRDGGDVLRIRHDLAQMSIRELIAEHYRKART